MNENWVLNGFFDAPKLTGLYEAAQRRVSCRSYAAAPTGEQWNALLAAAESLALPGVRIVPGLCDNALFQPMMGLLMKFENVQRYAAILATGASGYLAAADAIMQTATAIKNGINGDIPELEVIGDPTFLVAFKAVDESAIDIYLVNDSLKAQGWRMNSLQLPPALHFCITRPNTQPGTAEKFLVALRTAVDYAIEKKGTPAESGAMYGFGGTPQGNATLETVMAGVLDAMHEVAPDMPTG